MVTPASKLSRPVFKKMLSGSKAYVPKAVGRELKAAGMSKLLYNNRVSREQALKAVRHLQDKGLVSRFKPASTLFREAGIKQVMLDQQAQAAELKKHVQANIRIDVSREALAEDRNKSSPSGSGRALGNRVIDEIDREQANREKKVATDQNKRNARTKNTSTRSQKSDVVSPDDLPDIDID